MRPSPRVDTRRLDIDAAWPRGQPARVTLAELLVSLAVLGLLLGATLVLGDSGQRLYADGAARVEAQQAARIALERMAREIRQAGYGAATPSAIAVAERSRIVLLLDRDGNGAIAGNGETITWRLAGRILRRDAGGGAQPVVNGVRDLELRYYDGEGRETGVAADVRAVGLTLVVEPDRAPAERARRAAVTVTTHVQLRNAMPYNASR
jgi:hypothetical protein